MSEFRADLHCHTTCSDGSQTPEQIVHLAKEVGLSALSITDHDTIEAYATAVPLCEQEEIILLSGVEFSAAIGQTSVHILGYGFELNDNHIAQLCAKHAQRRKTRNQMMLDKLAAHGMPLRYEELQTDIPMELSAAKRTIGRPHIALAMIKKGYVSTPQEAFNKFLGDGKPCFAQGDSISAEETIDVIHRAKGVAVIAHPHLIKDASTLKTLLSQPFDGIECYYGKFHPDEHNRWVKIAKNKNWLITGGSDFHGSAKPALNLGCSWIGKEPFQAVLDRLNS